jgi:ABC-type transport system substrate-binding protein
MVSWQIKGLLLLASALLVTALAASTATGVSKPAARPAVQAGYPTAAVAWQPGAAIMVIKPAASWHDANQGGDFEMVLSRRVPARALARL